jgi:hypothetical protein
MFEPAWGFLGLMIGLTLGVSCMVEGAATALSPQSWRRDVASAVLAWALAVGLAIVTLVQLAYTMAIIEGGSVREAAETVRWLKWTLLYSPPPQNPVQGPACSAHLFSVIAAPSASVVVARLRGFSVGWQPVIAVVGWLAIAGPHLPSLRSVMFLMNTGGTEICLVTTCHGIWNAKWVLLGAAAVCPLGLRALDAVDETFLRRRG